MSGPDILASPSGPPSGGTGGRPPGRQQTRIKVGGAQPYDVVVGAGVLAALPDLVGKRAETVAVIHATGLGAIARPACRVL